MSYLQRAPLLYLTVARSLTQRPHPATSTADGGTSAAFYPAPGATASYAPGAPAYAPGSLGQPQTFQQQPFQHYQQPRVIFTSGPPQPYYGGQVAGAPYALPYAPGAVVVDGVDVNANNDLIYRDPANWRCGHYYGVGDTRLLVPNPDYCGADAQTRASTPNRSCCRAHPCARRTFNHAHPRYRQYVSVILAVIIGVTFVRYVLWSR